MVRLTSAKQYVAATAIVPVVALLTWPGERLLAAGCIAWIVASAIYWVRCERKEHQERVAGTIHAMQASGVRTLNHHRHDWMNDLQVLYGYMRLGKLDKTVGYVEKIRERMNAESAIAKLGVPSLISYIQTFRTITNSLLLEVEIEGDVNLKEMSLDAESVAETIIHTVNAYRVSVKPGTGEQAVLRLRLSADEKSLYASFYYEGELMNEQHWNQKIKEQLKGAPLIPVSEGQSFNQVLLKAEMREIRA
ncbi:Spo0B domain-containing protein [Paenibacillus sp. LHD-117]|uniref:Spo0B domain-containing protein n=1 Tax=Paenibacillus sp. LHD-117 TaxID=3071412 RepID=UPI0027DF74FC|nr:Spo0B domain-containing protein [Paenibacillus sp. LHD-117]MDQ6418617.1 Spo0B domain-containing protein [Paenibacillus sp. LHD-117]